MFDLTAFASDFTERFGSRPAIFGAPGRVNLIGEHTDYNDGFVLPFAIDKRTFVGCVLRDDFMINAHSRTLNESVSIRIGDTDRSKGWGLYLHGIAERLKSRGTAITGANLLVDSEIPFGAGLSSSAALEISVGLALATVGGSSVDLVDLAFAGQEVEHEYLGLRSGIMDQFTSALATADNALLIDCRTLAFENIPINFEDHAFVVCDSKVEHELADSAYNERRSQCEEGVYLIKKSFPSVRSLRDVSEQHLAEVDLPDPIDRRCRHVVSENKRTLESAEALRQGKLEQLGTLMFESHESLRDEYEVSCDELDVLVEAARGFDGVVGARMTGGGFGGCTINVVKSARLGDFESHISKRYREAFDKETEIFQVRPSGGARQEEIAQ